MSLPEPSSRHPLIMPDGRHDPATVFLNQVIDHPNIEIGDFSYYNDVRLPEDYASTLAPYLFAGAPEKLKIGRFCQLAHGVQFITSTANHPMKGVSTYPFAMFDPPRLMSYLGQLAPPRDNVVGHDCWIGRDAMLMPGASLGNGVIVGARSVIRGKVPDYAIVAGNPATITRMRFSDMEIAQLNAIAWWHWEPEKISRALDAIEAGDIAMLARF